MAGEMRMSMVLQANAGQALAEFRKLSQESTALSQELATVGGKAGQTAAPLNVLNTAAKTTGTALDAAAVGANRAAAPLNVLSTAAKTTGAALDVAAVGAKRTVTPLAAVETQTLSLADAMRSVAPAASASAAGMLQTTAASGALNAANLDLGRSIGTASREMLEGAQEAQAYRAALDQIRAQYSPLFAAQQQYEVELQRIAHAEQLTALWAKEAADARAAAATRLASASNVAAGGMKNVGMVAGQLSFQVQDFFVQMASGQSLMMAFAQQAPQAAGAFSMLGGRIGAIVPYIGTAIAIGAAFAPMLFSMGEEALTAEDKIDALTDAVDRFISLSGEANASVEEMAAKYGDLATQVRAALQAQMDFQLGAAMADLRLAITPTVGDSRFDVTNDLKLIQTEGLRAEQALDRLRVQFQLNENDARAVSDAFRLIGTSTSIHDQTLAASDLSNLLLEIYGTADNMPPAFKAVYQQLVDAIPKAAEFAQEVAKTETSIWDLVTAASNIAGHFTGANGAAQQMLGTVTSIADKMWEMAQTRLKEEGLVDDTGNPTPFLAGSPARNAPPRPTMETYENHHYGPETPKPRGGGRGRQKDTPADLIQSLQDELAITKELNPVQAEMIRHREILATATTAEKTQIEGLIASRIAEQESLDRAQEQMEELRNLGRDVLSSVAEDLRNGASAGDVLVGVLDRVADKLADMATDGLLDGLTGGGKKGGGAGGGFFGAIGNMLGGMKWFANGDVFGQPTMFSYGNGKLGVMGEAGAEAVMPLTHAGGSGVGAVLNGSETTLPLMRLGSGKLGVDLRGMTPPTQFALGGTFGTVPTPPLVSRGQQGTAGNAAAAAGPRDLNITVRVEGARGNQEIEQMVQQGVGQALDQYDRHVLGQRMNDLSANPWAAG